MITDNGIIGSLVIVKFFDNSLETNSNPLITRTLKKIGVIERSNVDENIPKNGELWKVRIVKEICEGQNKGCFVLKPVEIIDPKTLVKLVPGMYEEEIKNKILFIYPKTAHNCVLPLAMKRQLNYRAILVKLQQEEKDKTYVT